VCIAGFILSSCASLPEHYLDLVTHEILAFEDMLREVEDERVIFVGEIHADPESHAVQFEVIRHLHERGDDVLIAFEMFPYTEQKTLDGWINGTISRKEFMKIYRQIVNLPFHHYGKILEYARSMGIPVVGINADKTMISNVSKKGIETVSEDLLSGIKFTECTGNDEYARFLGFSEGKTYHKAKMDFLCDGQRLRDAFMAYHIANILEQEQVKVVVMVGVLHAAKVAVPGMLQNHLSVPYKVLMPERIRDIAGTPYNMDIADYMWY
jgi:uncharacterized iron-regulated protein